MIIQIALLPDNIVNEQGLITLAAPSFRGVGQSVQPLQKCASEKKRRKQKNFERGSLHYKYYSLSAKAWLGNRCS